jgi:hypothetical protein
MHLELMHHLRILHHQHRLLLRRGHTVSDAMRQLAMRQLAMRQLAMRQLAMRQLAMRQLAMRHALLHLRMQKEGGHIRNL